MCELYPGLTISVFFTEVVFSVVSTCVAQSAQTDLLIRSVHTSAF